MARRLKQYMLVAAIWLGRNNRLGLQNFVSLGLAESMLTKFRNMYVHEQPVTTGRAFQLCLPPRAENFIPRIPCHFSRQGSLGVWKLYDNTSCSFYLWYLLNAWHSHVSIFPKFRSWPPMQNNMLNEFYSKYAEKRTAEEWLDNHDFASAHCR